MTQMNRFNRLRGELTVPGDKSISHRAVMLGAISQGKTRISHFLEGADCLSTISCFQKMGISIEKEGDDVLVEGRGLHGLRLPENTLDVGNSGTTTRLMSGILAGQTFSCTLDGDDSLRRRPMRRIIDPLTQMGANIFTPQQEGCLPLHIEGSPLHGIQYSSPVASAQVKSCLLLAGLYADSPTSVTEPVLSRDHTERMLSRFGADLQKEGLTARILPEPVLTGQDIHVPGDISSAAFFLAAALLSPNAEILLKGTGINPTRDGFLRVCQAMGADIRLENQTQTAGEPAADLLVRSSQLKGTVIQGDIIPTLIDELPMIAVMAAFAQGTTVIRDAAELRVKESDRIETVCEGLRAIGCPVEPLPDGMIIEGGRDLHPASINSHLDHRLAMAFAAAGAARLDGLQIRGGECVNISYPRFYEDLASLEA